MICALAAFAAQPGSAVTSSTVVGATVASATTVDASGCGDSRSYREQVLADGAVGYWQLNESAVGDPAGRIAFTSDRDGDYELYTMARDGSGVVQLTNNPANDSAPAWSPDGKRLAFYSDRDGNGEIYVMNADGTGQVRLTSNAAADLEPSWSPGGDRIAFRTYRDGNSELYHMAADGTDLVRITNDPAMDYHLDWSPDGDRIVFVTDRDGNSEIYSTPPVGGAATRLTSTAAAEFWPDISPDGARIAYYSTATGNGDVYAMNSDGSSQTRITTSAGLDNYPAWSRDGGSLVFQSDRDGNNEVYTMRSDGSSQVRITTNAAADSNAAWQAVGTAADESAALRPGVFEGPLEFRRPGGLSTATSDAVQFAGYNTSSRVALTDLPAPTTAGGKMTVEFWMKWDGTNNVMPFGFRQYGLWLFSGSFGFNTASSDIRGIASTGLANRWVHVVGVFTNGDVTQNQLYIDGVQQVTTQRLGTPSSRSTTAAAWISGFGEGPWQFAGVLDEVALYPGALGSAQVLAHYRAATAPSGPGTDFGTVVPGSSFVTSTDCVVRFGSSNDSAMLTANQLDAGGTAMAAAPGVGVLGDWPLNDAGVDVSSQRNDLALVGAGAGWGAGAPGAGNALVLDGSTGYAVAPYRTAYDLQTFTVDLWFNTTAVPNPTARLVEKGTGSGNNRNFVIAFFGCGCPGPGLVAGVSAAGVDTQMTIPAAGLIDGAWHHAAFVVEPGTMWLYIDGALAATRSFAGTIDMPARGIVVGQAGDTTSSNHFQGSIDQVRLHSVARSASEIRSYWAGRVADYQAGVSDWSTGGANSMFGACLRNVTGAGGSATWTVNASCPSTDGSYWNAVAKSTGSAGAKVATAASGSTDVVTRMRFGFRPAAELEVGTYIAPITFSVTSPNV